MSQADAKPSRPRPPGRNREPGGRAVGPQQLRLVQTFVNTLDIEDNEDEIATPAHLRQWLVTQGLIGESEPVTEASHRRLLDFREAIRAVLQGHNGSKVPASAIDILQMNCNAADVTFKILGDGALRPVVRSAGIDAAIGKILCTVIEAERNGTWARLKSCRADDCRWAFYDYSKPGRSIWCTMSICGTRHKVRNFRQRAQA